MTWGKTQGGKEEKKKQVWKSKVPPVTYETRAPNEVPNDILVSHFKVMWDSDFEKRLSQG